MLRTILQLSHGKFCSQPCRYYPSIGLTFEDHPKDTEALPGGVDCMTKLAGGVDCGLLTSRFLILW